MTVFEDMSKDVVDHVQYIKMSQLGVYVMKIIKFDNAKKSTTNCRGVMKPFYERPMKAKVLYFNDIDLLNPIIRTPITETKYIQMARFTCLLKKHNIIQTYDDMKDWYLVYYKKSRMTIWFTFINQDMLDEYLPLFKQKKIQEIEKKFCWGGERHLKEGELERYYNGKE